MLGHNTGEPLDVKAQQQFHLILWHQASLAYEQSEFRKALSWYNYSLSLFPSQGDKDINIAKLQVIFLHLQQDMQLNMTTGMGMQNKTTLFPCGKVKLVTKVAAEFDSLPCNYLVSFCSSWKAMNKPYKLVIPFYLLFIPISILTFFFHWHSLLLTIPSTCFPCNS